MRKVAELAKRLGSACKVKGVRLDSGDLLALSLAARTILDEAGVAHMQIFASGGLTEDRICALVAAKAPIDAFGIGTDMSVSADAPMLDIVYKLTEYEGVGRMKLSTDKVTLPGRKQVFREFANGRALKDTIGCADEDLPGLPLLQPVILSGRRAGPAVVLDAIRRHATSEVARLPDALRSLAEACTYPVDISPRLAMLEQAVRARIARAELGQARP